MKKTMKDDNDRPLAQKHLFEAIAPALLGKQIPNDYLAGQNRDFFE
jgi:hypothetical protein